MNIEVVYLGSRLPLSSRRVVRWIGQLASHVTTIGRIEGLADGAILIRRSTPDGLEDPGIEITPEQAREVVKALNHAVGAVERWQERASGFDSIRIFRSTAGRVEVEHRGRRRPMRLSILRGRRGNPPGRRCDNCGETASALWVASDDLREFGLRVPHVEVCQECLSTHSNPSSAIVEVPMPKEVG